MSRIKKSGFFGCEPLALGKLRIRDDGDESFAGVCAGVAYWLGIPQWAIRAVMLAGMIWATSWAIGLYVGLYFVLPKWKQLPSDFEHRTGAEDD